MDQGRNDAGQRSAMRIGVPLLVIVLVRNDARQRSSGGVHIGMDISVPAPQKMFEPKGLCRRCFW